MNNKLKEYESYEIHNLESFYDNDHDFDRYIGFYIDKNKTVRGYICCIDTDEIDLEDFKNLTNADITVKQKTSITNELAIKFFENKIKNTADCTKETDNFIKYYSKESDLEYNEDDTDYIS